MAGRPRQRLIYLEMLLAQMRMEGQEPTDSFLEELIYLREKVAVLPKPQRPGSQSLTLPQKIGEQPEGLGRMSLQQIRKLVEDG
jgi:hypothetical protein